MRATRRAARDDPDPQIHAKETILHLLRPLFLNITSPTNKLSRSASLIPPCDVYDGGAPCQSWSLAGKQERGQPGSGEAN